MTQPRTDATDATWSVAENTMTMNAGTALAGVRLDVESGPQQGASHWLNTGDDVVIGNRLEHQLVLRDPSLAGVVIRIGAVDGGASLGVLEGSIRLDDDMLSAPTQRALIDGARLQLGDTLLRLTCPGGRSTPLTESAGEHGDTGRSSSATRSGYRNRGVMACMTIALLGLAISSQGALLEPRRPAVLEPSLEHLLGQAGYERLRVDASRHPVIVEGFLHSRQQARQLELLLRAHRDVVRNRVQVGETVAEQVTDIFRLNGIAADVQVPTEGFALVTTRVPDESVLRPVVEQARRDLAVLTELTVTNTPPPVAAAPAPAAQRVLPGKRVAMVVSDKPAHVVTEDRSRYFVGSLLPSGHRIAAIADGKVLLAKGDTQTELEF